MGVHNMCWSMFIIYVVVLLTMFCLMAMYHFKRKLVAPEWNTAFYYMFVFIASWIISRVVYLSDIFVNFNFVIKGILSSIPNIFTFICFAIAIDSM